MYRIALTAILCLVAAPAQATFELKDPANEAMQDVEDESWKKMADASCRKYVKSREKNNDTYFAALKWLLEYYREQAPDLAASLDPNDIAGWVEGYCRQNPSDELNTAADGYLETLR